MRLTKEERAARKAAFREMSLAGKADYIYAYYKLPVLLGLIALYLICSAVYRQMTKKEAVLYTAFVNVSVGDDLESQLNEGFISASGADPRKMEVYLYRGTYLSDDPSAENHAYGYASKLKLMAAIEAKQLAYLSGCGPKMPAMAADGTPWDKSWITLGGVLGVEKPGYMS